MDEITDDESEDEMHGDGHDPPETSLTPTSTSTSTSKDAEQPIDYYDDELDTKVRDLIPVRLEKVGVNDKNMIAVGEWLFFALKYDWKLKMLQTNPKLRGSQSRARYENYKPGATMTELLGYGAKHADFEFDFERGYLVFDTTSSATVRDVREKHQRDFGDHGDDEFTSAYLRINQLEEQEQSVRDEFMEIGLNHLESMTHNQQRLLRQTIGGKTLSEFAHICANNIIFEDPISVEEALQGEHAAEWRAAMDEEITNLIKFECFTEVLVGGYCNPSGCSRQN